MMYGATLLRGSLPEEKAESVTAGLKCAPEMLPTEAMPAGGHAPSGEARELGARDGDAPSCAAQSPPSDRRGTMFIGLPVMACALYIGSAPGLLQCPVPGSVRPAPKSVTGWALPSRPVEVQEALARVVRALPGGGEARPGQALMADAVANAISARRHLVVQAGTGTGKSLGYLVPAILSGRRVVVATATKALQDQLAGKDLPFLSRHLGRRFRFAVLKGRGNYLCRQRAVEVSGGGDQLSLDDLDEAESRPGGSRRKGDELGVLGLQVQRLLAWSRTSTSGDRAELDFEPRPRAWAMLSVSSRECPGRTRCPSGDECFAEAARDAAAEAQVVVVNTHLYATHLASGGYVLPDHDVVVFDEAHELEDVAAASLGFELGAGRFRALAYAVRAVLGSAGEGLVEELLAAGSGVERAMEPWRGRRLPSPLDPSVADALTLAGQRLSRVGSALRRSNADDVAAVKSRAQQATGHLGTDRAEPDQADAE